MLDDDTLADMIRQFSNDAWHQLIDLRDSIEMDLPEDRDKALAEALSKVESVRDYAARLLGDYSYMPDGLEAQQ